MFKKFYIKSSKNIKFNNQHVFYSPNKKNLDYYFNKLINNLINKKNLRIIRLSDGEYTMLFGHKFPMFKNISLFRYLLRITIYFFEKLKEILPKNKILVFNKVHAGIYNNSDINKLRNFTFKFLKDYLKNDNNYLALHLSFDKKGKTFVEVFFKSIFLYFKNINVKITEKNYLPSYLIYIIFNNKNFLKKIIYKKKILIINHVTKSDKIIVHEYLKKNFNCKIIDFIKIKKGRSFFSNIKVNKKYDLVLVSAGIGKFHIFNQLKNYPSKIIDIGAVIEKWKNNYNYIENRPFLNYKSNSKI